MKRFLLMLLLAFASAAAYSQVPEWYQGDLKKRGTRIKVDSVKLDKANTLLLLESVGGEELARKWEKDAALRNWGLGLTIGGYTTMLAGAAFGGVYLLAGIIGTIFVAPFGQEAVDNMWDDIGGKAAAGSITSGAGLAIGTTGVVLLIVGNAKMKKIVRYCNSEGQPREATLSFAPVPGGAGLVLNF